MVLTSSSRLDELLKVQMRKDLSEPVRATVEPFGVQATAVGEYPFVAQVVMRRWFWIMSMPSGTATRSLSEGVWWVTERGWPEVLDVPALVKVCGESQLFERGR